MMLLASEVRETGFFRYYELVGGPPMIVRIVAVGPTYRALIAGQEVALTKLGGMFEGPVASPAGAE